MKSGAQISWLPDGKRLHMHHGPIDLIVEIWGSGKAQAYQRAAFRFQSILEELVEELPELRRPAVVQARFKGAIAAAMQNAVVRHLPEFVTPMAAVAGAVADEIASVIAETPKVQKAYVNNGGDIALVLGTYETLTADVGGGVGRATLHGASEIRGIATSGWRGRSLSFGIADAVTVLASSAALADVAATLVGNAVDLPDDGSITRAPAESQNLDSDLGHRSVTVAVPSLSDADVATALGRGRDFAEGLGAAHGVWGGMLTLQGQVITFGELSLSNTIK
ncbi:UPF0280 family protein [uncultured Shimia sp.]|uniref:UPF0280 family protein n=1 Tax=uncultured Shimia sp. TaxID=573152 RepID=UPI00260BE93D|nr:UPF0280 family protein [uncultured Shimia sp.]